MRCKLQVRVHLSLWMVNNVKGCTAATSTTKQALASTSIWERERQKSSHCLSKSVCSYVIHSNQGLLDTRSTCLSTYLWCLSFTRMIALKYPSVTIFIFQLASHESLCVAFTYVYYVLVFFFVVVVVVVIVVLFCFVESHGEIISFTPSFCMLFFCP